MHVIITGATRGIGKAIAAEFAKAGDTLFVCSRKESEVYALMEEFLSAHANCTIYGKAFDLSIREHAVAFGNWILDAGYTPDILVNNAGSYLPGNVSDEPEGFLEKMMAVNLYSAYHLTRCLLPKMKAAGKGHIFNICSVASLDAYPDGGAYSISKFALDGFSKNLREELKTCQIKVTAVYPGATMSGSWSGANIDPERIMEASDVATMIYAAAHLSKQACVEEILLRPQLGDL